MKKFIRLISMIAMVAVFSSCLYGCGTNKDGKKTELKVGIANDGVGYAWIEKIISEFEKHYENVSFEDGKVGVKVKHNPQKEAFYKAPLTAALANNNNAEDIYYTFYDDIALELAKKNYVLNINDIVNEKVYKANGEIAEYDATTDKYIDATMSIYDKMYDIHQKDCYLDSALDGVLTGTKDGVADDINGNGINDDAGFYSIPYQDNLSGLIYDYDLLKPYLKYSGVDGIPDTEEELWDLFDEIKNANMIPFISGDVAWYMAEGFQDSFFAQYEGYKNAELCYTYEGTYTFRKTDYIGISGGYGLPSDIVEQIKNEDYFTETADEYIVEISPRNAWLLAYQPSKYAYASFIRELTKQDNFDHCYNKSTNSNSEAQKTFILSSMGKGSQKRIAMIQEGEWWENEAKATLTATGGYGKREFRFLPLPEIVGQKTNNRSIGNYSRGTDIIVNANTKKKNLCRLFLQFAHSETSLETFTLETGITRFYNYDLSDEQLSKLTPFGRDTYKIKKTNEKRVTIVTSQDKSKAHEFYESNTIGEMGGMGRYIRLFAPNSKLNIWDDTFTCFMQRAGAGNGNEEMSVEDYMDGVYRLYNKTDWENAYDDQYKG